MRRSLLAALAVAVLPATAIAGGGQRPQLEDPAGDWPVPSSDLTAVALSTAGHALRVELKLVSPPAQGEATAYVVSFAYPGCQRLDVIYQYGAGVPGAVDGAYTDASTCANASALVAGSELTDTAVTVQGSSVVWQVPLSRGLRVGARVTALKAHTSPGVATEVAGAHGYVGLPVGDYGLGRADYVVGQ